MRRQIGLETLSLCPSSPGTAALLFSRALLLTHPLPCSGTRIAFFPKAFAISWGRAPAPPALLAIAFVQVCSANPAIA